jgi:hypothetical protein
VTAASITADVATAVGELEETFPDSVRCEPDENGGAWVTVEIDLGERWTRGRAPVTFHVPYNYPFAPIYPYYLPADATPVDGWPTALQQVQWRGSPVVQVSLRHKAWDPSRDNALGCVLQMQAWAREQ